MNEYYPLIQTKGSVGYDMQATESMTIQPGRTATIPTSMVGPLSEDMSTFGLVCSRSGLARHHGVFVINSPGVIDADYTGVLSVILFNTRTEPFTVNQGDRIAQLLVFKRDVLDLPAIEDIEMPERQEGGFGSTGV